jgi:hypothetical protein
MDCGVSPAKGIAAMKWQLLGDWPIAGGARLLPAGTILDSNDPDWPRPPPLNARSLDDASALEMCMAYDEALCWHQLHFHPSVDHEAIKAKARHQKRWPGGMPQTASQSISERKDPEHAEISTQAIEAPPQAKANKAHHKAETRRQPRR